MEKESNILTHSMEDYLEMIYRKSLEEGYTRINILAESLNVQPPSATKMVQKLTKLGFVKYKKYGVIQLTEKGNNMGDFLLNRHGIIENFFNIIGVEEDLLLNIELMEHNITKDALDKIQRLNNFFKDNEDVRERFLQYTKNK